MSKFWDMVDSETKDKAESFIKRIKSKEIVKMMPINILKDAPLDGAFKKFKGKAKRLSETLCGFLKRKGKNVKSYVVTNINEGTVSEETRRALREEMEKYLRGAGHRKTIQDLARFR